MAKKIKRADLAGPQLVKIIFAQSVSVGKDGDILDTNEAIDYKKAPHDHLTNAFSKLVPHMMFATGLFKPETFRPEWFSEYEFLNDTRFDGIICTGIVMVGKDADRVKLLGRKVNEFGEVTALNAPILSMSDDESERKYPLVGLLREHVAKVLSELELFQKGKYGAGTQTEANLKVAV